MSIEIPARYKQKPFAFLVLFGVGLFICAEPQTFARVQKASDSANKQNAGVFLIENAANEITYAERDNPIFSTLYSAAQNNPPRIELILNPQPLLINHAGLNPLRQADSLVFASVSAPEAAFFEQTSVESGNHTAVSSFASGIVEGDAAASSPRRDAGNALFYDLGTAARDTFEVQQSRTGRTAAQDVAPSGSLFSASGILVR